MATIDKSKRHVSGPQTQYLHNHRAIWVIQYLSSRQTGTTLCHLIYSKPVIKSV